MTAARLSRGPAPKWVNPDTGHLHRLREGDRVTVRRRFLGPVTFTIRTWGTCRWPWRGQTYVAGEFWSALVTDVTAVEREGERLP